ncbi:serine/threonine kinase [Schistosoma mansoni]|uniref:serine/threonine kinase n=1 Tax=Schistosoma mansoni TaxID=6183 RepID=UPI0001A63AD9|nr:serine/threonine kinase [Schistosoma mansoni]|eukprot:XP_018646792.1 serine/threonine kinase [Schistosoma mansoni]
MKLDATVLTNLSGNSPPLTTCTTLHTTTETIKTDFETSQFITVDQPTLLKNFKTPRQNQEPIGSFAGSRIDQSTNYLNKQPQTQEFPLMTQPISSVTMKPVQNIPVHPHTEVSNPVGYIHSSTVPGLGSMIPIASRTVNNNVNFNSPTKANQSETPGLVLDGKSYEPEELLNLIERLRQDIRGYTDHIRWLEQELSQTRITLNARDRDIDKLKSVLDQKLHNNNVAQLPIYPVTPISDTSRQTIKQNTLNVTGITPTLNATGMPESIGQQMSADKLRTKKQGVSGESFTGDQLSGLVHHDKDTWSSSLIRDAISNNTFLKHLEPSQIEEIVACMYKKQIPHGCFIIREGEPGDALYVVSDGVLEVYKDNTLLGRMEVGRAFGELALLYNCKRTASVRAVTNASAWTLDRRVFQQIMMSTCIHKQQENMKFLKSVPALKDLSSEKMKKLADVLEPVFYEPGEYIIREGELGETFFIIKSGKVRVTHTIDGTDETKEIRQLTDGDWFGERALYTCEKRSANVISAEGGVHLLSLDRSNFIYLIGDLNEFKSKTYDDINRPSTGRCRKDLKVTNLVSCAVMGMRASINSRLPTPNKTFALKRMKKQHIVHTRQQEHICSERQIMLELRCPFICRFLSLVFILKMICLKYIYTYHFKSGSFFLFFSRGRFDDVMTRFVIACVLEAFTYLHTQGILYRDLKPENLLLDHKGYVKLCDFGFAKRVGHGKKTWTFCGTPEYVAPEIILNKGHDNSADYWSLGILIYELLTGSPPFTGTDPMKIYNVVLRGIDCVEFDPMNISRTATTLIKRLCAQNPAERLGYGRGGIIDIKQNKYFQGFDWIGLHRGTLAAPIQPIILGPDDTTNFDKYPQQNEVPPDETSGWDIEF